MKCHSFWLFWNKILIEFEMCFLVWWKSFWHLENKDVLQPIYYCPTWPEKLKNLPYNRSSYLNHITLAIIAFACSRNIDNNYTFDDWKTILKLMIKTKRKNLRNDFFEIVKVKNKICMKFYEIFYSISIGISKITRSFKSIKCKYVISILLRSGHLSLAHMLN